MGHKIIGGDLDSFAFNNVFQGLVHQIIIKSIYKNSKSQTAHLPWGELPLHRVCTVGAGATEAATAHHQE